MNVMLIANVMSAHKLTDVMVGALLTGKDEDGNDSLIQAGPKQIKALVERGFVSEEYGYLTEKGQLAYRALNGEDLAEDELSEILASSGTTSTRSAGTFTVDFTASDVSDMIVPSDNGDGVSWAEAKEAIRDHFVDVRQHARAVLKDLPKVRKADVTATARVVEIGEDDPEESQDDSVEQTDPSLFQAPVG